MYDVAIIGAGAAGLSAGITLACEGKSVVLLEKSNGVGGQIAASHLVENVVGYSKGFSGPAFALETLQQALSLGVDVKTQHEVIMLHGELGNFKVETQHIGSIYARSVLITAGVTPRQVPFQLPDGDCACNVTNDLHLLPATEDEHVVVYGGGNSAGQAAVYYAKQGCRVTLLSRRPVEETMDGRWIATMLSLQVDLVVGEIQHVDANTVVFKYSQEVQHLTPHTIHTFMGGEPTTSWLQGWVELDDKGYIMTDDFHCTSTYGIFAAGDCEADSIKRFSCAVGGATEAAQAISRCLGGMYAL